MNGPPQFSLLTSGRPRAINSTRIDTLTNTITLLTRADSLMPMTSKAVTSTTMTIAGKLMIAVSWG